MESTIALNAVRSDPEKFAKVAKELMGSEKAYVDGALALNDILERREKNNKYRYTYPDTYLGQDVLKRYLLSRIALRLLKIIEPYLVEQNRMANAQLLGYGSKHLGQNFFFY